MVVQSGVVPYTYLDLPFVFVGRRAGAGSGANSVPWDNEVVPLPEISGFLYEQAMFTHLAELRKYGDFGYNDYNWKVYVAATPTAVLIDQAITDPDPSGAKVSPSGNPYSLDFVEDLRTSLELIFGLVAWDTDYDADTVQRDYFQTSFSGLPSGQNGEYQYRVPTKVLFFGSVFGDNAITTSGVVAGSGFMDTQTITELHYQPYARLTRRGTHSAQSIEYDTAPIFPAAVTALGDYPITSLVEDLYRPGDFAHVGYPQTSGYNTLALASGVWRVIGDVLNTDSLLYFATSASNPASAVAVDRRWIGDNVWRNAQTPISSGHSDTPGIAYFLEGDPISLPHGVHKVIVTTSGAGWGGISGQISIAPSDDEYHVTGFVSGVIGDNVSNGGGAIVRNTVGGVPSDGTTTSVSLSGQSVSKKGGVHVCDKAFATAGASGMVIMSPFNAQPLLQNTVEDKNYGGDGSQKSAYFTKIGPPTWVWRQVYETGKAFFRNAGTFIREPGASEAFALMGTSWTFRSYTYQNFAGPVQPTGAPQQAGSNTTGLGQTDTHQFLKFDFSDRSVVETKVGYSHLSHNNIYSANGLAYSRNWGWFGVGGPSHNGYKFETFRINGTPDAGSFIESNAGGLELVQPIGIGDLAFAKLAADITTNIRRWWELRLGTGAGYNTILVKAYDLVVDGDLPFEESDITLIGIQGHAVFVESNDEGITAGDWVNVNTNLGTFFCRVEVDSGASEIQIKECLFPSTLQPQMFLPL